MTAADKAMAVALFQEGKSLMERRDFTAACEKLEESQRLDPGGGTVLNLALCHEGQGRTATAWAEFIEALGMAKRDRRAARVQFAEEHVRNLEPLLARLTVVVPPGADEPDLEVRRDGALVGRAAWGMAFPVDPGDHVVQATAPDKRPWGTTVSVGLPGQPMALTVQVPPLGGSALAAAPGPGPRGSGAEDGGRGRFASSSARPEPRRPQGNDPFRTNAAGAVPSPAGEGAASSPQRTWGWVALGVGAVGVTAGSVLGVTALSKKNQSRDRCPKDPCDAGAVELGQAAGRAADWATVSFAVGLSSAAVGTLLLLTSDPSASASAARAPRVGWALSPEATPHGGGLSVGGRFW